MSDNIKLPPLPKASNMYDIPGYDEEELKDYARAAILADRASRDPSPPAEGEDIMVNTPYDVFTLPLHPSGLSSGPRFVVHVPAPEQPAPHAQSSTEAWRDLAIAGAAIVDEIREIVGLKGKPGDVVEAVRKLVALRDGQALACSDAVRTAYSDERRRADKLAKALRLIESAK